MENEGKIYCIIGKSSSGKDSVYRRLIELVPSLKPIILYTTRPLRDDEADGREYHFINREDLIKFDIAGKIIEVRHYKTTKGVWSYATVDDGQINPGHGNYIVIATLESYVKMSSYYGAQHVVPIYIELDDGTRLLRAVYREMKQENPAYDELCRRYIADNVDFSKENVKAAGIRKAYINDDLEKCVQDIIQQEGIV